MNNNTKNKRNNKQKKKKRQRRNTFNYGNNTGNKHVSLALNTLMPPSITRSFKYIDGNVLRTNAGATYLVYSLVINDLYDPDPLILSGSVSGYKELMQFYLYARVNLFNLWLDISNNENFPVQYGLTFTTKSLVGVVSSRDDAINALETGFTTGVRLLSPKGGLDRENIHVSLAPSTLVGSGAQYSTNLDYTCQITSSPLISLYVNFIIASTTASNLSNGVTTALTCGYKALLYSRTNLRA